MTTPRTLACFSVSAVLTTASMSSACPPTYELIGELEYDCGSQYTIFKANTINESRQVVGEVWCHVSNTRTPFYWTPEEGVQLLPMSSENLSAFANDINESGVITGTFSVPGLADAASAYIYQIGDPAPTILWSPDDEGWPFQGGFGIAINDDGVVAGVAPDPQGVRRACVWTSVTEPTFLPGTLDADDSIAKAINNANQIAFETYQGELTLSWVYTLGDKAPYRLEPIAPWLHARIGGIGSGNVAVGAVSKSLGTSPLATRWIGTRPELLPTTPETDFSVALGITESGTIYGEIRGEFSKDDHMRGVVWEDGVLRVTQHVLGPDISIARPMAMNARGDFVASSTIGYIVIGRVEFPLTDLNCDQTTSFGDLLILLASWGECEDACAADLDGDGAVSSTDLDQLLGAWML